MGIPKFYRYISERYPCLNETLKEYQIPEFDNLYLDVNGIIHGCSHPNDSDVSFRITEQEIFENIFRYIELLFRMIQPRKLFFIAIDGVAPRAKINQQRGRRFRSAKDAEVQESKARAKGMEIPPEKRFDSNAITPGTDFMNKVNKHLRYFVTNKISMDKQWQSCKFIFSGSEVPGEGEHKIMDYIRYLKAQPEYDIHTKHCLYGLDADLIMLGLCTHEIHFTLLREEITYGKKQTKLLTPEETKFCLFHLSLLREYIDHEFSSLKEKLPFPYDLEKIIDDWILMGFLVGNDFIPHLPNLHIAHGALCILYQVYMDVLPTLEGYINEEGTLNLDRFEKFMERLSCFDILKFSEHYADLKYLEGKMGRPLTETDKSNQKKSEDSEPNSSPRKMQDKEFTALLRAAVDMSLGNEDELDEESDSEIYTMEFVQHKKDYYINKLKYEDINEDFLRSQAEGYVTALQWNLHYYYNGCCSWTWYYPHHYAPYISDIKDFKNLKLEFELGEPFLPFEQLLSVLPPYSKDLLPSAFQTLLTDEASPIKDYYPVDFETDLNGKTQEWEAVVLIPFIDATRLKNAMEPHYSKLTEKERARNKHGPMYSFTYSEEYEALYSATAEYFSDFVSRVKEIPINREDIMVPREKLVKGLCKGVCLDLYYPGFPTLQYVEHTATFEKAKVKVFQRPSLKDSMILHIKSPHKVSSATDVFSPECLEKQQLWTVGKKLLGQTVFVNWPYLTQAQVTAVATYDKKLTFTNPSSKEETLTGPQVSQFNLLKKHISEMYMGRLGIDVGEIDVLVYARPLVGCKYDVTDYGWLRLEKQWSDAEVAYAYQTIVKKISLHSTPVFLYKNIESVFIEGSSVFMLGQPYYGVQGTVQDPTVYRTTNRIKVCLIILPEPSLERIKKVHVEYKTYYMQGSVVAKQLGISSLLLSKITGTIYVKKSPDEFQQDDTKYNIGLNLKFNKKNEEIPGYTRKENGQWLYSSKVIELIRTYMVKCPELFERLAQNITNDFFLEENLFNKETGEMNDILAWLKEQLQGVENRACGVETLDPTIVTAIEEEVDSLLKTLKNVRSELVVMKVKPHLLFKPELHLRNMPPDPKAQTILFDRICCVKENFTVPVGYRGTVIGIQKMENYLDTMYDVVFDKTFRGGFSICGCSESRGYRLAATDFINISYGERMRQRKGKASEAKAESINASNPVPNHKAQSCANASAFASYKKETNLPSTSKTPSIMKPTTEFQILWNELHTKQPNTRPTQVPMEPRMKQVTEGFPNRPPHDPSEFLKAMLKISDGKTQPNTQQNMQSNTQQSTQKNMQSNTQQKTTQGNIQKNTAKQTDNKTSDTPPLVQQLFDHARQNEIRVDERPSIWYCSELLSYYQFSRQAMPRYYYFKNKDTNLISARIHIAGYDAILGDPCEDYGEAAGNVAKKAYEMLRLGDRIKGPSVTRCVTWWNPAEINRENRIKYLTNAPMPPRYPPPTQQHNQGYHQGIPKDNQYNKHHQPQSKLNHNEVKTEIKDPTSFVPLQAQKKSINIANRQTDNKNTNKCAKDNPRTVVQQEKKELPTKTTKVETTSSVASEEKERAQSSSHEVQNTQNVIKPKKSRVAAKFFTPSQIDDNCSSVTTSEEKE